jgi:predicted nucleotidyltransferase
MRLTNTEVNIIKQVILYHIKDAKIILFGSRVYDNKKGGDIDLLIQTKQNIGLKEEIKILAELEINGIERKVDLVLQTPFKKEQNIFKMAISEGVIL